MQAAALGDKDDTKWVESENVNNEYVEIEDPHPDEFQDDGWVDSTYVKNITAEFNMLPHLLLPRIWKYGIYLNEGQIVARNYQLAH